VRRAVRPLRRAPPPRAFPEGGGIALPRDCASTEVLRGSGSGNVALRQVRESCLPTYPDPARVAHAAFSKQPWTARGERTVV